MFNARAVHKNAASHRTEFNRYVKHRQLKKKKKTLLIEKRVRDAIHVLRAQVNRAS